MTELLLKCPVARKRRGQTGWRETADRVSVLKSPPSLTERGSVSQGISLCFSHYKALLASRNLDRCTASSPQSCLRPGLGCPLRSLLLRCDWQGQSLKPARHPPLCSWKLWDPLMPLVRSLGMKQKRDLFVRVSPSGPPPCSLCLTSASAVPCLCPG